MSQVAVVGAGITGLTTAYYLARQGHDVTVYEQERYPAMKTSYANGGQVSVSNSEVWTTWSNVAKGLRWMFKKDAPLLIRPSFDLAKIKWISKFLWATATKKYEANTAKTIRMGLESSKLYKQIIAEEGIEFDQSDSGILHFYKNEKYFKAAQAAKDIYDLNGCEWNILNSYKTKALDPNLGQIEGLVGGAWTATDWTGDIHKFCKELARVLAEKYNVSFVFGAAVKNLKELKNFDRIVVSNGVGSVALARTCGDSLPIYPVKGYSITINNVDPMLLPRVSLLDDEAKIVTATLGNKFRVAGTAELNGENYDIRRDRIEPLLDWVHKNFPEIDTRDYTSWACLRPMTPDMMPIVQQSKKDKRVFYNTGHGHLGWTLAAFTAKAITEKIQAELK